MHGFWLFLKILSTGLKGSFSNRQSINANNTLVFNLKKKCLYGEKCYQLLEPFVHIDSNIYAGASLCTPLCHRQLGQRIFWAYSELTLLCYKIRFLLRNKLKNIWIYLSTRIYNVIIVHNFFCGKCKAIFLVL